MLCHAWFNACACMRKRIHRRLTGFSGHGTFTSPLLSGLPSCRRRMTLRATLPLLTQRFTVTCLHLASRHGFLRCSSSFGAACPAVCYRQRERLLPFDACLSRASWATGSISHMDIFCFLRFLHFMVFCSVEHVRILLCCASLRRLDAASGAGGRTATAGSAAVCRTHISARCIRCPYHP